MRLTIAPKTKPQNGAPILNTWIPLSVTRNDINPPRGNECLNVESKADRSVFIKASAARVLINAAGAIRRSAVTVGAAT